MGRIYVGERAVSLATGLARWVVVASRTYGLQTEAVAYLASLRARGCSPNTGRAYTGQVTLYLNYCLAACPLPAGEGAGELLDESFIVRAKPVYLGVVRV